MPIGATTRPNLIYGFGVSAQWKGFDINVHFQGAGKSSFFIDGFTVYPFKEKSWGNILTDVVGNYWSLGTNEDPNARYPRLSYGGNDNNYRASTYWLRNGSIHPFEKCGTRVTVSRNGLSINSIWTVWFVPDGNKPTDFLRL